LEFLNTNEEGLVEFTGKYGSDLLQEIRDYALVANIIAQDYAFDIIHAHDWLAYPAGMAAKEATGKPLVVHVHATDFDRSGGSVNPAVFDIEKRGMEAADMVITVSNMTRRIVVEKYGIDPDKVVTVYNAVEPHEMAVSETRKKGAGSGDMMESMIRRAAQLKITDKFHFTGFLRGDDVFDMLVMSDLYVMPSVSEPFGISPLEAMQSNVPVLISHQSGVAEILTYAIKTNFWDVDAMADAIYGVLNYSGMSKMFVAHGKKEVDSLKWENSAIHVKAVYDKALARR
jgi:glycosyltransferase involved in cell wall biosynthesis